MIWFIAMAIVKVIDSEGYGLKICVWKHPHNPNNFFSYGFHKIVTQSSSSARNQQEHIRKKMSCLFYVGMFRLANHSSYSKAPDGRPLADLGGREGGAKMRARGERQGHAVAVLQQLVSCSDCM